MMTTSETILFTTVWTLTVCGLFFGGRAKLRKRQLSGKDRNQDTVD